MDVCVCENSNNDDFQNTMLIIIMFRPTTAR